MKLYVVTSDCYGGDLTVEGVFSTEEKAKKYVKSYNRKATTESRIAKLDTCVYELDQCFFPVKSKG